MSSSSSSSPILENFIQSNYLGVGLPPLWEVIYHEAIRGHHLLFSRTDVERYDRDLSQNAFWEDAQVTEELEAVAVKIVACAELQDMVRLIDALSDDQRRNLYTMYRRVLWMWRNYIKES